MASKNYYRLLRVYKCLRSFTDTQSNSIASNAPASNNGQSGRQWEAERPSIKPAN